MGRSRASGGGGAEICKKSVSKICPRFDAPLTKQSKCIRTATVGCCIRPYLHQGVAPDAAVQLQAPHFGDARAQGAMLPCRTAGKKRQQMASTHTRNLSKAPLSRRRGFRLLRARNAHKSPVRVHKHITRVRVGGKQNRQLQERQRYCELVLSLTADTSRPLRIPNWK